MMTQILSIIIIYVFISLGLWFQKKKNNELRVLDFRMLKINKKSAKMFFSILWFFGILVFYIFLLKILRLFRDSKYIDLEILYFRFLNFSNQYNILVIIFIALIYIFFIKRFRSYILYKFKESFLSLNYYFQARSEKYMLFVTHLHVLPQTIWLFFFGKKSKFGLKKIKRKRDIYNGLQWFFYYIGYTVVLLCFLIDLCIHGTTLSWFSTVLPWFSVYQLCYWIIIYFNIKIDPETENFVSASIYLDYLYDQKLKKEHAKINSPIPYGAYKNVSIHILGDKPPVIPQENVLEFNNYVLQLLE